MHTVISMHMVISKWKITAIKMIGHTCRTEWATSKPVLHNGRQVPQIIIPTTPPITAQPQVSVIPEQC